MSLIFLLALVLIAGALTLNHRAAKASKRSGALEKNLSVYDGLKKEIVDGVIIDDIKFIVNDFFKSIFNHSYINREKGDHQISYDSIYDFRENYSYLESLFRLFKFFLYFLFFSALIILLLPIIIFFVSVLWVILDIIVSVFVFVSTLAIFIVSAVLGLIF